MDATSQATPVQAMPNSTRSKRKFIILTRRVLVGLLIIFVGLIAAGVIYQAVGAQADRRNFPPPGKLYDVGGYRLHLYCTGPENTGNPTVILETLSGGTLADWGWIQPEIAHVTRVCSYDRAGRGWSEPSLYPLTLKQVASDLHALLQRADVKPPYVLVGHSIGGAYVREFAALFPGEADGMVLVDSALPEWFARFPQELKGENALLRLSVTFSTLARIGLFRLYFATGHEIDFAGLPPKEHAEVAMFWSSPSYFISQRKENLTGPSLWVEARTLGNLRDLPLAVVTRGKENQLAGWAETQDELAKISSNSIHLTVDHASHASLAFTQNDARVTSLAILKVLEAARTGNRLASQ